MDGRAGTLRVLSVETRAQTSADSPLVLADPRLLPRRHAAVAGQVDAALAADLRQLADRLRAEPPALQALSYPPATPPTAASSFDHQVYDTAFGVTRSSGNAVALLAEAARRSVAALEPDLHADTQAQGRQVRTALAELFDYLATLGTPS